MKGYLVFIRRHLKDEAEMKLYGEKVGQSVAGHKVTPLVRYGNMEVLEGPPATGAVLLEFDSTQEARDWYESAAYQQAAQHRKLGSEYDVLLLEGV